MTLTLKKKYANRAWNVFHKACALQRVTQRDHPGIADKICSVAYEVADRLQQEVANHKPYRRRK